MRRLKNWMPEIRLGNHGCNIAWKVVGILSLVSWDKFMSELGGNVVYARDACFAK